MLNFKLSSAAQERVINGAIVTRQVRAQQVTIKPTETTVKQQARTVDQIIDDMGAWCGDVCDAPDMAGGMLAIDTLN